MHSDIFVNGLPALLSALCVGLMMWRLFESWVGFRVGAFFIVWQAFTPLVDTWWLDLLAWSITAALLEAAYQYAKRLWRGEGNPI